MYVFNCFTIDRSIWIIWAFRYSSKLRNFFIVEAGILLPEKLLFISSISYICSIIETRTLYRFSIIGAGGIIDLPLLKAFTRAPWPRVRDPKALLLFWAKPNKISINIGVKQIDMYFYPELPDGNYYIIALNARA
jgi:hypothetical protein